MWIDVLCSLKRMRWLSIFYIWISICAMVFDLIGTVFLYSILTDYSRQLIPLYLFFLIPAVVLTTIWVLLRRFLKKRGANKNGLDPYIVKINPISFDELINKISESNKIDRMENGFCSKGNEWGLYGDFLCIYSNQNWYEADTYVEHLNELFYQAKKTYGIKDQIKKIDARHTIIVFINTFNSFDEDLEVKIRENAFRNLGSLPIWYEIFIDLFNGRIYIPAELSAEYGISKEYIETIKYLKELFTALETN